MNENIPGGILIVDDTAADLGSLADMLASEGYEVRAATTAELALASCQAMPPALILMGMELPDMNSYMLCKTMKQDEQLRDIPIIFINTPGHDVKAYEAGGADYITNPFQFGEVLARVETQLTLYQQRREIKDLRVRDRDYFETLSEMKDEMLRTVSHDVRNPLNGIIAALLLLRQYEGDLHDDTAQRYLDEAEHSARHVLALITNLLDLARIETGLALQPERLSLSNFLRETLQRVQFEAGLKQISLALSPPQPDIELLFDPARLEQALRNLLSNAIKYTQRGGHVELCAYRNGSDAIIEVVDNGMGIPPEEIPHVFKKFYRVRANDRAEIDGTGLGLSIVRSIIRQHGGRVWVESEVNKGSTFTVALPVE